MAIPVPSQQPTPDPGYPVVGTRETVVLIGPGDDASSPAVAPRLVRLLRRLRARCGRSSPG